MTPPWDEFLAATGDQRDRLRNRLVEHYLPLAHRVAFRYHVRTGYRTDLDDLRQDAALGLRGAVNLFAPGRGIKFETYAPRRILGALLDRVRERDWVPRLVRKRRQTVTTVSSLATPLRREERRGKTVGEVIVDRRQASPVDAAADHDEPFGGMLRGLGRTEKSIATLIYRDGLTMKEVGAAIGISESRVSQIHSLMLEILRAKTRNPAA